MHGEIIEAHVRGHFAIAHRKMHELAQHATVGHDDDVTMRQTLEPTTNGAHSACLQSGASLAAFNGEVRFFTEAFVLVTKFLGDLIARELPGQ